MDGKFCLFFILDENGSRYITVFMVVASNNPNFAKHMAYVSHRLLFEHGRGRVLLDGRGLSLQIPFMSLELNSIYVKFYSCKKRELHVIFCSSWEFRKCIECSMEIGLEK